MLPSPDYEFDNDKMSSDKPYEEEEYISEPEPDYDNEPLNSVRQVFTPAVIVPIPVTDYNSNAASGSPRTTATNDNNYVPPPQTTFRRLSSDYAMNLNDKFNNAQNEWDIPNRSPIQLRKDSSLSDWIEDVDPLQNVDYTKAFSNLSTPVELTLARVLKDWRKTDVQELDVYKGEILKVLEKRIIWWKCEKDNTGEAGWVPAKYLRAI
ncbi:unnamed protein product [Anisakis simplex]|uniref:SH3 domain-containing protein n=1 Tax=Anisakis simplex TaxID=6269 RepID=A0A0M3K0K7_ANISI|nr:unnamed protein product [Anisakis simplex]